MGHSLQEAVPSMLNAAAWRMGALTLVPATLSYCSSLSRGHVPKIQNVPGCTPVLLLGSCFALHETLQASRKGWLRKAGL